ncbi:MAG: hypothetical protein ACI9VT_000148 [Psychroserpens sp.]
MYAKMIIRQGMKKLLILILAGSLYFHYYPNEKLNSWLFGQKEMVLSYFSDAIDTKIRLKSDKIYQDLSQNFGQFTRHEKAYVAEITSSREKVKIFNEHYCKSKKQTPKLHRDNLTKVCYTISKYSNLL